MRCYFALAALALSIPIPSSPIPAYAAVHVWEGILRLPTYEEGPPDPNPPFDQFATNRFNYPYTLRENITDRRVKHAWRAVYLENEYLKCSVLPDIGGHVYTCTDKISGQPMFYANPSIKKAQIGYRGAWAAFGIEFNFPVSHNWVSMSPVDYAFTPHRDGSASVTVGNIDRVYGMEWSVELLLRPGSTLLEQSVTLSNRSDVRHRFYWWNNAGIQVWDDSRVEYPMRFSASHGFTEVQTWPVNAKGTDLSVIRNQTGGPVSLFVHGSREPFMGVWNPATNTGTAHYAEYAELPAKKIWSWGVDADGLDWRRALSDNNSAYVEVQGGLFRNQETYAFLEPRQTIRFSEFWMPVRNTGGISRANLAGAVHLQRQANSLTAAFNVNERIGDASIRILNGDKTLFESRETLSPERTWSRLMEIPDGSAKCTFELRDREGNVLLRQTEGLYDWTPVSEIRTGPQRRDPAQAPHSLSEDDWVQAGKDEELNGQTLVALSSYEKGLALFPTSFDLMKCAGRLAASLLRFDEAVRYLQAARMRDTSDPEISYYLGLAYEGSGDLPKAQAVLEEAYRLPQFRAAGALKLAELSAQRGDFAGAGRYLLTGLRAAPGDLRGTEELAAVRRAAGQKESADSLARESLSRFPLSAFLRDQLGESDLAHLGADPERVLRLAGQYMQLGLYRRAIDVLAREYPRSAPDRSEPGALLPQEHPMIAYFRGYCRSKVGESPSADYARAQTLSTAFVFPEGAEARAVLRAAASANPHDETAHYLLGAWYFAHGLTEPALEQWGKALERKSKIPVLHASMGLALLRVAKEPEKALAVFREGATVDPENIAIYSGMDQAMSILQRPAAERVAALERYPNQASMPAELVYELALSRAEAGNYTGAIDAFRGRFFPRQEGGTNVRQVWVEVRLQQIVAMGSGGGCKDALASETALGSEDAAFPFTRDGLEPMLALPRTKYLLGAMERDCGQPGLARKHFEEAAQSNDPAQLFWAEAAAKRLDGFDPEQWRTRLGNALAAAKENAEGSASSGYWLYTAALLEKALGTRLGIDESLRSAILLPDRMLSRRLARLALAGAIPE